MVAHHLKQTTSHFFREMREASLYDRSAIKRARSFRRPHRIHRGSRNRFAKKSSLSLSFFSPDYLTHLRGRVNKRSQFVVLALHRASSSRQAEQIASRYVKQLPPKNTRASACKMRKGLARARKRPPPKQIGSGCPRDARALLPRLLCRYVCVCYTCIYTYKFLAVAPAAWESTTSISDFSPARTRQPHYRKLRRFAFRLSRNMYRVSRMRLYCAQIIIQIACVAVAVFGGTMGKTAVHTALYLG